MSKRNKIIFILIAFILILASVGITYAFFSSVSNTETSSTIFAKGGSMSIKYANGSGNITMQNIYPRANAWVNKTFTVTGNNTTDLDMYYSISLVIDNADISVNLLTYTLNGVNTSNNGSIIPSITTPEHFLNNTTELGVGKFNKGNNLTHSYVLNIYFKDDGTNQNYGQEMNFSAHLIINNVNDSGEASYTGSGRNILTFPYTSSPLTKTFNVDSGNIAVPYDYDIYLINNSNSNYSSNDFTYTLKGTDKSSSGTVANITNQALSHDSSSVKLTKSFAGSAETVALMYKSQGIIKSPLAYNDNFTLLSNKINSDDTIAAPESSYVEKSNYSEIFKNTTKGDVLNKLESWYEEKLATYTDYLEDVIWCNDKSYNTSTNNFGSYTRFNSYTPSLVCPNDSLGGDLSKYTVSDTTKGNGALTYKIGLLTADELMFAGASSSSNTSFYLYVNSNDDWWTLSPSRYRNDYYGTFTYVDRLFTLDPAFPSAYLRPAIAIKSTAIVGGTGTKTNPYVILAV